MDEKMREIFVIIYMLISTVSFSQDKVELLNKGNECFQEKDFKEAEEYYKKSLEEDNQYYKANLNTGHSLFRQAISFTQKGMIDSARTKCSEAESYYINSELLTENKNEKAESLYNLGNAQLLSQKLEKSIESYKKSLRLVPENMNAKHNLALAQYLLKKNQENQEDKKEQENKEEEKKKDQSQENKQEDEVEEKKEELSEEAIKDILNALEREEQKVQENLPKVKRNDKKLLKDW
ncbi:tetratricopeptide repeat protein [Flavobacteriales bacterium]|nr:tetratricopeptide repeat protein [Flavobacteriales bacterium]